MAALKMNCAESIETVIDYGVATRPATGETVSGDLYLIKRLEDGVLLAVVDGVGHGDEALAAALTASLVLEHQADAPLISLIHQCHQALARTRGAVMTVARLNTRESTLTWLGVGNVEGHLFRAEPGSDPSFESVLLRNGLVGGRLPALQASVLPLAPDDLLIFATDGIRSGFSDEINRAGTPQQLARRILHQNFKGNDDALVLAVLYHGGTDG